MMAELEAMFATYQQGGKVKMVYETKLFSGQISIQA
jgi:hypothetical protein